MPYRLGESSGYQLRNDVVVGIRSVWVLRVTLADDLPKR
jgi:hypothetical protein